VAALAGLAPDEPEPEEDEPQPEDDEPEPEDDEPEPDDDEPAAAGAGVPVEAGVDESDLLSEPAAGFSALTLPARESLR
jgi:hypothetical protein